MISHDAVATTESYRGVLDRGTRLGAHFVTAASLPAEQQVTDVASLFGRLVQDCDAYQLVPLLVPQPDTSVATLGNAFGHRPAGRRRDEHLGYLRVLATDLDAADDAAFDNSVAGLLATVPVHVPIAVGSAAASGTASKQRPGTSSVALLERARGRYHTIDIMLEHPRARAELEGRRQCRGRPAGRR